MSSDDIRNTELPDAEDRAAIREWLLEFSAAVRAEDYDAGRPMFAPEVIGFGTYADALSGLDALIEGQWKNIWGVTRGFEYDVDAMRCEVCEQFAWVAVTWRSQKQDAQGVWRNRPGRATMILQKCDGKWLAVHSHFSLNPSLARSDYLEMDALPSETVARP